MQTTPNFLTSLQSTNMDLQSKLTQTNKEKPTPVLNFKPMSVSGATEGKKLFSEIRQKESEKFVQENKPGFITQQLAKIGTEEKQVEEKDIIQSFLDETKDNFEYDSKRKAIISMLQDGVDTTEIEDTIVNKMQYTGPKKGFIGGAVEKTGEAFKGGLGRIKEAGVGIAEGKYNVAEGFARGGAGALESAFSPITGVLGQTIQEGLEKVPQDFKDYISKKAEPAIEDVKAWYNSQSPEQQRNLQNIGVGVELLANFIGVKGIQKGTEAVTPTIKKTGEQIAQTATDIGKGAITKADEGIQATKQTGESVITGLSKEQIKGFQSNPYQATEFQKLVQKMDSTEGIDDIKNYKVEQFSGLTDELTKKIDDVRATKGETGQAYQVIRDLNAPVNANKISTEMESVLKKAGMEIKDGTVIRKPGIKAGELNQADVGKFNQLYQDLQAEILRNNGTITPAQTLDFRKTISDLAKYDASNTTTGQTIMQSLRRAVDDVAKQEIPGLRELDKQFVDKLNELNDALRDLVYKGGDVKGEWRSNIENIISTLDRSNRNKLAKRLEEVMPGISERVQAINNIPTIYKSLQAPKLADKVLSVGGAAVGFGFSGPVGLAVGYAIGKTLDKGITLVRKNAIKKTLNNVSESGKARMTQIGQKIAKNKELSKIDKDFLNKFKTNVQNTESSLQNRKLSPTKNTQTPKKSVDANRTSNSMNDNISMTPRTSSVARSIDSSTNNVTKTTQERKLTPKQEVKSDMRENKPLNNKGGYIDPIAMVQDISKVIKNLTPKNTYNIATQISKKLGVEVKKVHTILKEYVSKYGEKLKDKLADLADDIADKTGARAKLLAGENAKFAPTNLEKAKMMDKLGNNADDIWEKTGWEKGTDGKWRFEIDDSKAKLTIPKDYFDGLEEYRNVDPKGYQAFKRLSNMDSFSMSEIQKKRLTELQKKIGIFDDNKLSTYLDHKDLYENYPKLKDTKIEVGIGIDGRAFFNPIENKIVFNKVLLKNKDELKSVLLHEVQHVIQETEGFAKGGSYEIGAKIAKGIEKQIENINKKLSEYAKSNQTEYYDATMSEKLQLVKELRNVQDEYGNIGVEGYKKLAGETEARNVQTRLGKTASERKKLAPSKTEDVPRKNQILRSDSKIMQSVSGKGTGISGKIDAPKELIEHMNKFENAEDFYQKTAGNIRKEFDKAGLRYKSDYEKFFNKYKTDGGEKLLDTINPTGTLFTKYTPKLRANSKIDSSKITTLADTAGKNPNDTITIYRGTVKSQKDMNPGDFVTTNYDLAKSYSGEGYVVSKKVKYSDILDEIDEPLGEEYLYIPSKMQKWK